MQEDHMDRLKMFFRYNCSRTLGIFICALLLLLNCLPVFAAEAYTASGAGTRDPAEQGSEDAGAGAFTKISSNAAIGTAGMEPQTEEKILEVMSGRTMHVDDIIEVSGIGASKVLATLTLLEIAGVVKQEPGKRFTALVK